MSTGYALQFDRGIKRLTALASDHGVLSRPRQVFAGWATVERRAGVSKSEAELLQERLSLGRDVVRRSVRHLGSARADTLFAQLRQLLDPADWESGDQMLGISSLKTFIRVIIATNLSVGSLTVTRAGNVACTWIDGSQTLRIEAFGDGSISWARLSEAAVEPRTSHGNGASIADLCAVLTS